MELKTKFLDAFKNAAREVADGMRFCGISVLIHRIDLTYFVNFDGKVDIKCFISISMHFNIGNLGLGRGNII